MPQNEKGGKIEEYSTRSIRYEIQIDNDKLKKDESKTIVAKTVPVLQQDFHFCSFPRINADRYDTSLAKKKD